MKLDIKEKLSLAYLGEGWEECYLSFSPLTVAMAKKFSNVEGTDEQMLEKGLEMLRGLFVDGKVLSGGQVVDMKPSDFNDLPVSILNKCVSMLSSSVGDEKKELTS